jgi:hypothetical protein
VTELRPPADIRISRMTLPTLLLNLIQVGPFIAMTLVVVRTVRALATGEVKAGGRRSPVRQVSRSMQPFDFWFEVGLHVVVGVFLFLMGLLLTGHAPAWLIEVMDS